MNIFIKLAIAILFLVTESCDSSKTATSSETSTTAQETKQMQQDYLAEGYSIGTIKHLKDSECSYIIIDEKTGAKFDPINIDEQKFVSFKSDQEKIYYKYGALRMMNRCIEAQPISLLDIKKRED